MDLAACAAIHRKITLREAAMWLISHILALSGLFVAPFPQIGDRNSMTIDVAKLGKTLIVSRFDRAYSLAI
ncbi:hypothetical protein CIW54_12540 [Paraburkholderia sp. T12-10]|nr:hypothetical protein CIW54_12540 [Paraburkholderia sp. T12-10]